MAANRETGMEKVDRLVARRDWAAALRTLDEELVRHPGSFPLLRRRAEVLDMAGNRDDATEAYRQLAEVCVTQGFYARASAIRNKIARLHPDRPELVRSIDEVIDSRRREEASRPAVGRVRRLSEARTVGERQAASEFLRSLPPEAITPFLSSGRSRAFGAGETLFREGEPGATVFFLEEGTVAATTTDPEGRTIRLGEVGPGELIGEVSVLSDRPRTATVVACRAGRAVVVERGAFEAVCRDFPQLREAVESLVRRRARATVEAMMRSRGGEAG